jgi:hypothetical protein
MIDSLNSPSHNFNQFEGPPIPISPENSRDSISNITPDIPIQVRFVNQRVINGKLKYVNVDATSTYSSNLSAYATSSLPYFEDKVTNRGSLPAAPSSNSVALTLNPDIFGNITI